MGVPRPEKLQLCWRGSSNSPLPPFNLPNGAPQLPGFTMEKCMELTRSKERAEVRARVAPGTVVAEPCVPGGKIAERPPVLHVRCLLPRALLPCIFCAGVANLRVERTNRSGYTKCDSRKGKVARPHASLGGWFATTTTHMLKYRPGGVGG